MSGGYDGKVIIWDIKGNSLIKFRAIADIAKISQFDPGVVSIDYEF